MTTASKWRFQIKLEIGIYRHKDEDLLAPVLVSKSTIATIGEIFHTEKKAEIAKNNFLKSWLFIKYNFLHN